MKNENDQHSHTHTKDSHSAGQTGRMAKEIPSLYMFSIEFHTWVVRDTDFILFYNHKSGSELA